MIKSGIDIIEISRIEKAVLEKHGFLKRVYTDAEIEYFQRTGSRMETLAGMFAAKEAFSKFLGSGVRGFKLSDVELAHDALGAPFIIFKGERLPVSVSISHNKGFAAAVVCGDELRVKSGYDEKMRALIPVREKDANKGSCGRILIVAGSRGMTGAACLSAYGALRSGAGLVTVATPESEQRVLAVKLTEAMTLPLPHENGILSAAAADEILSRAESADAVAFGPGLGRGEGIYGILSVLVKNYCGKLIIDADGINALSRNIDILREKNGEIILTPHPGEMSRLTTLAISEIQADRERIAAGFSKEYGVVTVLKGRNTVIADKDGRTEINLTGNEGMATGGTGDVLSGVVASFAAQGLSAFDAAALGAYIHGKAGDIAKETKGVHGLIAMDVADSLPRAIMETV